MVSKVIPSAILKRVQRCHTQAQYSVVYIVTSPTSISLLSVLTPSATCCTYPRMFCATTQINTDPVCPLGTRCLPSASHHAFHMPHFGPQLSRAKKPSDSFQLHAVTWCEKSTGLLNFPQIMFHLYLMRGPAEPHQFPDADASHSRRPHQCLLRQ